MDSASTKTLDELLGSPAPRDLDWTRFVALWKDLAEEVQEESGSRLAVLMNGHRVVFHRPHDGRVGIEDVERARQLFREMPSPKGVGNACAVVIDAESARLLDFDLDVERVEDTHHRMRDDDARAHHLRTVERHTGRDDVADLKHFFDEVILHIPTDFGDRRFAVLGHGQGKSDVAAMFVERMREAHPEIAKACAGIGDIDLSAANDADLEDAAMRILRTG